jgi:NCS1 family nucleobase:cation symporter-1
MVLSRISFGWWGNALPAGLNAVIAGIGWFAVNSVSGALALNSLTRLPSWVCLLIVVVLQIVIAYLGHNLVQVFERYAAPVLGVIFAVACIITFVKGSYGGHGSGAGLGGFLVVVGATFGYAAGWTPYGSDYTRYLPADTPKWKVALWPGLGVFLSCTFLEIVGAASATLVAPKGATLTGAFIHPLPDWLGKLTLLAIAIGGIAANALNVYSGTLSFVALGIKLPAAARRATVALVFGVVGTAFAWSGLSDSGEKYENFLLVISYWIGPWLAVVFLDRWFRRGESTESVAALLTDRRFSYWAGPIAMAVGTGLGVWLFSNQTDYTGVVPKHVPALGDIAFFAGAVIAGVLYLALRQIPALSARKTD